MRNNNKSVEESPSAQAANTLFTCIFNGDQKNVNNAINRLITLELEKLPNKESNEPSTCLTIKNQNGDTFLHLALKTQRYAIFNKILTAVVALGELSPLKSVNSEGETPLLLAIRMHEPEIIKKLLQLSKELIKIPCEEGPLKGFTPLIYAAKLLKKDMVKLLLEHITAKKTIPEKPLNENTKDVEKKGRVSENFIQKNISRQKDNKKDKVEKNSIYSIQEQLEIINYADTDGNTALHCALNVEVNEANVSDKDIIATMLINHGASIRLPNFFGKSPQDLAEEFRKDYDIEEKQKSYFNKAMPDLTLRDLITFKLHDPKFRSRVILNVINQLMKDNNLTENRSNYAEFLKNNLPITVLPYLGSFFADKKYWDPKLFEDDQNLKQLLIQIDEVIDNLKYPVLTFLKRLKIFMNNSETRQARYFFGSIYLVLLGGLIFFNITVGLRDYQTITLDICYLIFCIVCTGAATYKRFETFYEDEALKNFLIIYLAEKPQQALQILLTELENLQSYLGAKVKSEEVYIRAYAQLTDSINALKKNSDDIQASEAMENAQSKISDTIKVNEVLDILSKLSKETIPLIRTTLAITGKFIGFTHSGSKLTEVGTGNFLKLTSLNTGQVLNPYYIDPMADDSESDTDSKDSNSTSVKLKQGEGCSGTSQESGLSEITSNGNQIALKEIHNLNKAEKDTFEVGNFYNEEERGEEDDALLNPSLSF